MAGVAALFVAAIAMTVREPRLWEYHNELVGGSQGAYRYFANEGLDLGQRFAEIRAFHDREIAPSGRPLFASYWMIEEQVRGARLNYRRRVESLDDSNVEGRYDGYFVYTMLDTLPWPNWDWDPEEVFRDLELVARFGHVGIWKGVQVRPQTRASSLSSKVMDYIYEEGGSDWALVAQRLEEVAALLPQKVDTGVELGNAYLRLGEGGRRSRPTVGCSSRTKCRSTSLIRATARDADRECHGGHGLWRRSSRCAIRGWNRCRRPAAGADASTLRSKRARGGGGRGRRASRAGRCGGRRRSLRRSRRR